MPTYIGQTGTKYDLYSFPNPKKGGEGEVFLVRRWQDKVAKIYFDPLSMTKQEKLKAMYDIRDSIVNQNNSIAWVLDILYDDRRQMCGFIMPKLNFDSDISQVYESGRWKTINGKLTETDIPFPLDNRSKIVVARNICVAISTIHRVGCVFGDFNPNNIGVSKDGIVSLCDTDSCQIFYKGKTYRCTVCLDGYVAPELLDAIDRYKIHNPNSKKDFEEVPLPTFTKDTDNFALAIHIFRLLMNGESPYTGIRAVTGKSTPSPGLGNIPVKNDAYCFKSGLSWDKKQRIIPLECFPPEIANLFTRAFVEGKRNASRRPSAEEWYNVLQQYESGLVQCRDNPQHQYHHKNRTCPYCDADERYCESFASAPQPIPNPPYALHRFTRLQQTAKPNFVSTSYLSYGIRILPAVALLSVYEIWGGIVGATIGAIIPYLFSAILGIIVGAIVIGLIGCLGGVPGCIGGAIIGAILGFCSVFQQPPTTDTTLYTGLIWGCAVIGSIWGGIAGCIKVDESTSGWLNPRPHLGKYSVIGIGLTTELVLLVAFLSTQYYKPYLQQYNPVPIEAPSDPSSAPAPIKDLAIFEVAEKGTVQDLRECIVDIVMKKQAAEKGCVHMRDVQYGATLLHRAAWHNKNVDVVKYLVSSGADINANDREYGATPLHWAAENENVNIAKYLVSQGADVNAKNKNGMTPLDHAKRAGNTAVVKFLSEIK